MHPVSTCNCAHLRLLRCPKPFGSRCNSQHSCRAPSKARQTVVIAVLRTKQDEVVEVGNKRQQENLSHSDLTKGLLHEVNKKPSIRTNAAASLFPSRHVQQLDPLFILYFPIGVSLAAVRITLWVVLLLMDQAWLTDNDVAIRVLQAILGVQVKWHGADRIPSGRHVLVSNHVTTGDMMALYRRPKRIVHLISTGLPKRVAEAEHHRVDLRHASRETYDQLADSAETDAVHLFPEGGMTNGTGMMKFSRGFLRFADGLPVVPVALRAQLPWNISTHTLNSNFLANMFWFCFSPWVRLDMSVLQPTCRRPGEGKAKFVERVQKQIAEELQIPVHGFTLQAKKQLMQSSQPTRR